MMHDIYDTSQFYTGGRKKFTEGLIYHSGHDVLFIDKVAQDMFGLDANH